MTLTTPVSELNRVGKVIAKRLETLGIETAEDLLFHFPFRYEDFSQTKAIRDLVDGEQVTVKGKIELIANKRSPRKHVMITEAVIADDSGRIRAIWFNQPFIGKTLKQGDVVYLSGKVSGDMFGKTMTSPSYERENYKLQITNTKQAPNIKYQTTHTARLVPIYPLTSGITQKQIRYLMKQIIDMAQNIPEWLPDEIQERADVMPLSEAIRGIHFPEDSDELKHAERRLKFDELFLLQLRAEMIRQSLERLRAPALLFHEKETKEFVVKLPYILTKDQKIAAWEIIQDMQKEEPMNRLLEGDVGSGKTVVAAMALYNCMLNGYQGVLLAPTEILAKQHYESLMQLFHSNNGIALLTSSEIRNSKLEIRRKSQAQIKKEIYELIADGKLEIIVGTHALLQEDVRFAKLGLVVVDEQHRFGVEQRKLIKEKSAAGLTPHFLSMTATPIPRSLALTVYGDLELSIIREKPPGRKEIKTRLVEPRNREKAYQFIREQVVKGRQVFVICPLIEGNKESGIMNNGNEEKKSVINEFEKLSKKIFSNLRVEYLHGKMKSKEKDGVMKKFTTGELDILVATSVVEVGVNIPNASVMMIEGADRFGLAQLHQFRGRVGRAEHQSYCLLFTETDSQKALARLSFFEKHTDGFELAEYDLDERGPGEVYGTTQSGLMQLRLATMRDGDLIRLARAIARGIDFGKYQVLRERVEEWEKLVHLE